MAVNARTRACAAAFIRLAADVLALQEKTTATREVWREAVVTLDTAFHETSALLALIENDPNRTALTSLLRQMLGVAETVAAWLEGSALPPDVSAVLPRHDSAQHPVGQQRRRPWFGTEVEGAQLWPGAGASRSK